MFGKKIALMVDADDYDYLARVSKAGFRSIPDSLRLLIAAGRMLSEETLDSPKATKTVTSQVIQAPPVYTEAPNEDVAKRGPGLFARLPSVLRGRPGRAPDPSREDYQLWLASVPAK